MLWLEDPGKFAEAIAVSFSEWTRRQEVRKNDVILLECKLWKWGKLLPSPTFKFFSLTSERRWGIETKTHFKKKKSICLKVRKKQTALSEFADVHGNLESLWISCKCLFPLNIALVYWQRQWTKPAGVWFSGMTVWWACTMLADKSFNLRKGG